MSHACEKLVLWRGEGEKEKGKKTKINKPFFKMTSFNLFQLKLRNCEQSLPSHFASTSHDIYCLLSAISSFKRILLNHSLNRSCATFLTPYLLPAMTFFWFCYVLVESGAWN